jgi:hypothetical protein
MCTADAQCAQSSQNCTLPTYIEQSMESAVLEDIVKEVFFRVVQTRQCLNFIEAVQDEADGSRGRGGVLHPVLRQCAGGTVRVAVTVEGIPFGTADGGQHSTLGKIRKSSETVRRARRRHTDTRSDDRAHIYPVIQSPGSAQRDYLPDKTISLI